MTTPFETYTGGTGLAPALEKLVPPERPDLVAGIEQQGYELVPAWNEGYQGVLTSEGGNASDTIEFNVEPSEYAIDLSRSFVSVSFTTQFYAGDPVVAGGVGLNQPCSLRNGGGQLLFRRSQFQVNNVELNDDACQIDDGEGWSSFIQVLTREKSGFGRGGAAQAWAPLAIAAPAADVGVYAIGSQINVGDGAPDLAQMTSVLVGGNDTDQSGWALADAHPTAGALGSLSLGENTVWPVGVSRGAGNRVLSTAGGSAQVVYRPATGLWRQGTCLPPGARINMKLFRSASARFLQCESYAAAQALRGSHAHASFTRATLWLYRIKPSHSVGQLMAAALSRERFFVPFKAGRLWSNEIPAGSTRWEASGLFPGTIPQRVYIGLTRAFQQGGLAANIQHRVSPWAISQYGRHEKRADAGGGTVAGTSDLIPHIDDCRLLVAGRQFPEEALDTNLVQQDDARRYKEYINSCADPSKPVLSFQEFRTDYPLLVIDLSAATAAQAPTSYDQAAPDSWAPYSAEGLTIRLSFDRATINAAVPDDEIGGLTLFAYAEHNAGVAFSHDGTDGMLNVRRVAY